MSYYIGKTTYQKQDENGRLKTANDHYLINALSFTEAEAHIAAQASYQLQHLSASLINAEPEARMAAQAPSNVTSIVTAIRPVKVSDIFESDERGEIWYEAKAVFYSIDERSGKEKKVVNTMYLNAESLPEAVAQLTKELSTMLVPYYIIESIKATPIIDYLAYYPTETPATTPVQ